MLEKSTQGVMTESGKALQKILDTLSTPEWAIEGNVIYKDRGLCVWFPPKMIDDVLDQWCYEVFQKRLYSYEQNGDAGEKRFSDNVRGKLGEMAFYVLQRYASPLDLAPPFQIDLKKYESGHVAHDFDLNALWTAKTCIRQPYGLTWLAAKEDGQLYCVPSDADNSQAIALAEFLGNNCIKIRGYVYVQSVRCHWHEPELRELIKHKMAIYENSFIMYRKEGPEMIHGMGDLIWPISLKPEFDGRVQSSGR